MTDCREESLKEYQAKVKEKLFELNNELGKHGFVSKLPRVEYLNGNQNLYFHGKDGSSKLLCGTSELEGFLDDKVHFSAEEEEEIRQWYEVSLYKLGRESHRIEQKLKDSGLHAEKSAALKAELQMYKDEITEEGLKARAVNTLGYYYGETDPERKALLCKIVYGLLLSA